MSSKPKRPFVGQGWTPPLFGQLKKNQDLLLRLHLQNWNWGGPEVYINNQPPSAIMCFLKWACKTVLGPLKHVLHLVWSVYVTSKAIKTALKVELLRFFFTLDASPWLGQIMVSKKKKVKKKFFCLKSVSGIIDRFSIKKMKKKFHRKISQKRPNRGAGGGPRGGWQKTRLFPDFFLLPSLKSTHC